MRWPNLLASDNTHPNETGQYSIADMIYKAMSGYATWNRELSAALDGSGCVLNDYNMKVLITNNIAKCDFSHVASFLDLTFKPVKNFTQNVVKVMAHNMTFVNEQAKCTCNAIIHDSSGYSQATAILTINPYDATQVDSGAIYMQLVDVEGSGYKTWTNVDEIQLYGVEFTIPLT